jgi:hypothetical protein
MFTYLVSVTPDWPSAEGNPPGRTSLTGVVGSPTLAALSPGNTSAAAATRARKKRVRRTKPHLANQSEKAIRSERCGGGGGPVQFGDS